MSDGIAYCLSCKKKVKMVNIQNVTMKNGRSAQKAKCGVCGGGVYKILPGSGTASKSASKKKGGKSRSKKSRSKSKKKSKSKKGGKSKSKKKSKSRTKSRRKSKKA